MSIFWGLMQGVCVWGGQAEEFHMRWKEILTGSRSKDIKALSPLTPQNRCPTYASVVRAPELSRNAV